MNSRERGFVIVACLGFLFAGFLEAGTNLLRVYTDVQNLITAMWTGSLGTVMETNAGAQEGTYHLRNRYVMTNYWDQLDLRLDSGGVKPLDARAIRFLRLAYRGPLGAGTTVTVRLGDTFGKSGPALLLPPMATYKLTNIPVFTLTNGSGLNLGSLSDIRFDFGGLQTATNYFFTDHIIFIRHYTNVASFRIFHDGRAVVGTPEQVVIEARDINNVLVENYAGKITLDTTGSPIGISWLSDPNNKGVFTDGSLISDGAAYQFSSLDKGRIVLYIKNDVTNMGVNINAWDKASPSIRDDDTEGLMNFYSAGMLSGGILIDDFEDGDLIDARGGAWSAYYYGSGGSTNLAITNDAAGGSTRALAFRYNSGKALAGKGPYISFENTVEDPVHWDLSPFSFITFDFKGSGYEMHMLLEQTNIYDGDWYRYKRAPTSIAWENYTLFFDSDFAQEQYWGEDKPMALEYMRQISWRPVNANEVGTYIIDNVVVGPLYFEIIHDGTAAQSTWEQIVLVVKTLKGIHTNYTGTASLYVEPGFTGPVKWTNTTRNAGVFHPSALNGRAAYAFSPADKGVATLRIRGSAVEAIDPGARSTWQVFDINPEPRWLVIGTVLWINSKSPGDGEMDVAQDADIQVVFNRRLNPATVTTNNIYLMDAATLQKVPVSLTLSSSNVILMDPIAPFLPGKAYRVYVTTDIRSAVGNLALLSPNTWVFTAESHYYVNDTSTAGDQWCSAVGNDVNDGLTPATPKRTISAILAAYSIKPGKIIYVDTGTYSESVVPGVDDQGNMTDYVYIKGSTNGATITSAGNAFTLTGRSYIWIENLRVTAPSGSAFRLGDRLAQNNRIQNNYIYSSTYGVYLENATNRNVIYGNAFFGNGRGIYLVGGGSGGGHLISRNTFRNHTYAGVWIASHKNIRIDQNIFTYNNLATKDQEGGIRVNYSSAPDFAIVANNTIASDKAMGIRCDSPFNNAPVRDNLAIFNTAAAFNLNTSTPGLSYSCLWANGAPGTYTDAGGNITGLDPLIKVPLSDLRLAHDSPLKGAGSQGQSIGRYTAWVAPSTSAPNAGATHTIRFATTFAGSIPTDGQIWIEYPAGFRFSSSLSASSPGLGSLAATLTGPGLIRLQRSGGLASVGGNTETIVLSGVTNAAVGGFYRIRWWTRRADGRFVDDPDPSNDFLVGVGAPFLAVSCSVPTITLKGAASTAKPGATAQCVVLCSNRGGAADRVVVYMPVPPQTTFRTNSMVSVSGWTCQYSTNLTPNQSYNSPHYARTNIRYPVSRIRWVRWKAPALAADSVVSLGFRVIVR